MKKTTAIFAMTALALAASTAFAQKEPVIGLITKTDSNPFFVKMKEGAEAAAKKAGVKLMSAAGNQALAAGVGPSCAGASDGKESGRNAPRASTFFRRHTHVTNRQLGDACGGVAFPGQS